jgi:CheY-like chemotaxis protein
MTNGYKYKSVLLVDDSEIDNFVNKKLISKTQFAKETFEKLTARSALEFLQKESANHENLPDIIFLDIMMPIMDGFAFLNEFDKLPESVRKKCKIVMLSSSESFKDLNRANSNKYVKKFLNKPLNEKALQVLNV